jgi:hydroxylamine reductase
MYAHRAEQLGQRDRAIDHFVTEALFTTVTNVNFDPVRLEALVAKAGQILDHAKALYTKACHRLNGRFPAPEMRC